MRKPLIIGIAAAALALGLSGPADAAVQIIVNAQSGPTTLTAEELESVFLGKKTLWGSGVKVLPALPQEESVPAKEFIETMLNKTVAQYQGYWKRRLFSGGGTVPRAFATNAEIVDFVGKNPGAIAVTAEPATEDDKIKVVSITKQ